LASAQGCIPKYRFRGRLPDPLQGEEVNVVAPAAGTPNRQEIGASNGYAADYLDRTAGAFGDCRP